MAIIEQRFLRGPNLWSSQSCLLAVLDLGRLRQALSTDVPGFTDALLVLLPGLRIHEAALRRGCFVAEVVGMAMLELQQVSGAPAPSSYATVVMGRAGQVRLMVASTSMQTGGTACAAALALVVNLYTTLARRRAAAPIRLPIKHALPVPPSAGVNKRTRSVPARAAASP